MIFTWNHPAPDGGPPSEELLVAFDRGRAARVMVCPAWFDEANKLRRFTVEVMRRLDKAGIDSFLPDLPGTNESTVDLASVTPGDWAGAVAAAPAGLPMPARPARRVAPDVRLFGSRRHRP